VEVYSKYFESRILNVVLNRWRCVSFEPPPLGESCITKVADSEFAVQSKSSIDVVYSVDTERLGLKFVKIFRVCIKEFLKH